MKKKYDLQQAIDAKRTQLSELFKAGGDNYDLNDEQVGEIRAINAELTDLGKQLDQAIELEGIQQKAAPRHEPTEREYARGAREVAGRAGNGAGQGPAQLHRRSA